MIKSVLHTADSRHKIDIGWLKANHTFSFSNYYNPERMNFGVLRVLNDDIISPGMGFGKHPHDNMEIISIPLEGTLEHKDSMGNTAVIEKGEIQVMSAGKGVFHSEYNPNKDKNTNLLQIWIIPNKHNVEPRYDQIKINLSEANVFHQILSPYPDDAGVWIYQQAWFSMGKFQNGKSVIYDVKNTKNGVYAFIIYGNVTINGQKLQSRDGFGVWEIEKLEIEAMSDTEILLIEVPISQ